MIHEYFSEIDKERQDITWTVSGDIDTEEIVVKATKGEKIYEKRKRSAIFTPSMAERVFGIDVWDLQLSYEISNEIYQDILRDENELQTQQ